jgi:jumonji domain-containing protein 7
MTNVSRFDAIVGDKFVLPKTEKMTLAEFFSKDKSGNSVYYIQSQNSSLTAEFADLLGDLENGKGLPYFAKHIFLDDTPEAVNIWIGGSRSVTSLHKDHYDNLYGVVRGIVLILLDIGRKTLKLFPPTDYCHFKEILYPTYQYNQSEDGDWYMNELGSKTPWVSRSVEEIPVEPLTVDLFPGDILFLPCLWFV